MHITHAQCICLIYCTHCMRSFKAQVHITDVYNHRFRYDTDKRKKKTSVSAVLLSKVVAVVIDLQCVYKVKLQHHCIYLTDQQFNKNESTQYTTRTPNI